MMKTKNDFHNFSNDAVMLMNLERLANVMYHRVKKGQYVLVCIDNMPTYHDLIPKLIEKYQHDNPEQLTKIKSTIKNSLNRVLNLSKNDGGELHDGLVREINKVFDLL